MLKKKIIKKRLYRKLRIKVSKNIYRLKNNILENLTREANFIYWGLYLTVKKAPR